MKVGRLDWFLRILILTMVFLIGRLVVLQLIDGEYYKVLADENRVKLRIIRAERGKLYDRHGEVLAENIADRREYMIGEAGSHVLGYVGEISEEELRACEERKVCEFEIHDVIGKMGLEQQYDKELGQMAHLQNLLLLY